jgi:hypothetical protein
LVVVPNGYRGPIELRFDPEISDLKDVKGGKRIELDSDGKARVLQRDTEYFARWNRWEYHFKNGQKIPDNIDNHLPGTGPSPWAEVSGYEHKSDGKKVIFKGYRGWVN